MPFKDPETRKAYQLSWQRANREAVREANRRYSAKPEYKRKRQADHRLLTYGITPEQLQAMYDAQGGVCPLCGLPLDITSRHTHVDHHHITGEIRGLLHHGCNIGLAYVENVAFRSASIRYLEKTDVATG